MMTRQTFLDTLRLRPGMVLAIDGKCGSGKTTLASLLAACLDVDVIHLDSFFLPVDLRTPQRFAQIGGNVHYERFLAEVLQGIASKQPFSYRHFDCKTCDYAHSISVSNTRPIVVEGSYSLRPEFRPFYTQTVYLHVDEQTQAQRILKRNGPVQYQDFLTRWIPRENAYFQGFDIANQADLVVDGRGDSQMPL